MWKAGRLEHARIPIDPDPGAPGGRALPQETSEHILISDHECSSVVKTDLSASGRRALHLKQIRADPRDP
jgi:hypothetical protein